ncbi:MAG: DNA repair protein RadC [Dehalococcoidia bacterium]|nr:DNA repair protein RadC [Dehalococcoidia bacterium]
MSENGTAAYRSIRELDEGDRPREKLLRHGPGVLSEAELLAIVLGSGLQGENVLDMARRVLETMGNLPGLVRADTRVIQRAKGVGPAKAAQIAAAIELGRRVQQIDPEQRPQLTSPEAVYRHFGSLLLGRTNESLLVLSLDTKGRLLGAPSSLDGTVNAVNIRPAEVFREPVVLAATSVILVHNHPSGDPQPSPQDVAVTRELVTAGQVLGITVHDHVVVGQGSYVSMRTEGLAFRKNGGKR